MLAAVALNHLDETFLSDNDIKTAGIYLDYRQATMQTFENVFAGLLAQLIECQQPLKGTVREMYKKHSGENTRPSLAEITDVIENDVRTCKAVYVVIDALDEFEDAHRMSLISQLQSLGSVVRLMITSRQIQLAQDFLAVAISLDICASDEDIRIYTQDRIRNNDRLSRFISRAADLENLIVTTVLEKARDNDNNHSSTKKAPVMFLHAKLQMDTIANKTSIKAIRKALDSLPGKLDDLYHEAMERIRQQPEDDKRLAEQTLIWVVHAYEPLRFETIQHALAVECGTQSFDPENLSDSDLILNVCAGLLTLEPESSNLRLVHYTAQDYFKSHPVLPCPHGEIVKTCVNFLSYEILRHPPPQPSWDRRWYFRNQDVSLSYLYRYVSEFWAVHAGENEDAVTDEVAKEFLVHSPEVLLGYPTTCPDFYDHNGIGLFFWSNLGLATAAFFGLNRVMEKLRPGLEDINSRGSGSFTALHLAANKAKIETMAKLISWGAEVDLLGACGSPLFQAVLTNSKPAINILLQNNANPNAQDGSHVPLIEAITRCDKQVIDALIEHGAHIDARGKYRETPLLISIREGRLEIARRLLEKGANPNINGWSCGMPPLQFASTKSEVEYTDLLLNYGAVINRRDLRSKTALHEAAYYNSLECAKLLVQNGADIEAKDEDGRTPLHWSFWRDLESRPNQVPQTMLFLLSRSNVNAADHRDHHTILHQAVLQRSRNPERRMNIIKAILDTPIDTECPSRPVITVILQYKLIDVCRRLNPDWKTSSAQWHLQENSHGPSGVLCSHPDDVTNLQTLSRLPSIKSVVYWSGGMTALDYAECLGDEVEAQVLRPRTKSTTRRLTMTIRDYLDEYHPGHDF